MAINQLSPTNTFMEWLIRTNEVIQLLNGIEGGSANIPNTIITGTLFNLKSNTSAVTITNPSPSVGEDVILDVAISVSDKVDDVSTSNIASANSVATAFNRAEFAVDEANIAYQFAYSNSQQIAQTNDVVTGAFNRANTANAAANAANANANGANTRAGAAQTTGSAAFAQANVARTAANTANSIANQGLATASNTSTILFGSSTPSGPVAFNNIKQYATTANSGVITIATREIFMNGANNSVAITPNVIYGHATVIPSATNTAFNVKQAYDFSLALNVNTTLTGDGPPNGKSGQKGVIMITANGGPRTVTLGSGMNLFDGIEEGPYVIELGETLLIAYMIFNDTYYITSILRRGA